MPQQKGYIKIRKGCFMRHWPSAIRFLRRLGLVGLILVATLFAVAACGSEMPQIESPTPTATPIATTASISTYQNLSVDEAKLLIQKEINLVVLDVRTKVEYESGHLPNAILIPVAELQDRLAELDKDKKILVYCQTGVRSAEASQILVNNGFGSVYNLVGGINAWIQADGPVVSDSSG
jgi:rhodanese-related sulfurtransferase